MNTRLNPAELAAPAQEPVGTAVSAPGTPAFSMAWFDAPKVPAGTKLYTRPTGERGMNVQDIWREAEKKRIEYRTKGEEALLKEMFDRFQGLKELGWNDAMYCPKDGSHFLVIEAGSTGVFPCTYQGEWPKGTYWLQNAGDLWPSRPILWKPMPKEGSAS